MKNFLVNFFKNKFNTILFIVQVVACLFFALGNVWGICFLFAVMSEGVFFFVMGVRSIVSNREIMRKESMLTSLPIAEDEIESLQKSNKRKVKSNQLQGVLYILMGLLLVFIGFF